ncbi:MAG: ABC transporter permease [Nitrospinae bacterium]|nr:ABC transporter permease [Nitrospinota bacterium]
MLLKLSWRNIQRRKRRTFVTALTVAFGVFLSVTFTAMGDYSYTNMINTSARMGFGHVTVEPQGYNASPALDKRIAGTEEISKTIARLPDVERTASRITGQAMFSSAAKSVGGIFMAIDPAVEGPDINVYVGSLVEGKAPSKPDGREALVGVKLKEKLNLGLGKKFVFTTTDAHGELISEVARVAGVFKTGVDEVDGATVILPIGLARTALGYAADEATLISVFISDHRDAGKARASIANAIKGKPAEVLTWSETQADLAGHIAVDQASNYIYQFLVGIMIAAGILNTIMMGVLERWREFGVMIAVGLSPIKLFAMVLLESLWLGIAGLILGVIITTPWYLYMKNTGLDLSFYLVEGSDISGVLLDPVMKFRLYRESVMGILTGVFFLTLVAGLYPAWKAGRVNPVDTLKDL